MAVFVRLIDVLVDEKAASLRDAVATVNELQSRAARSCSVFHQNPNVFRRLPLSPFAYWISSALLTVFERLKSFQGVGGEAWAGLQTNDDYRWLRLWTEVEREALASGTANGTMPSWVPCAKGGEYSPYYSSIHLVVEWGEGGRAMKEWKLEQLRLGHITANNSRCWNEEKYFRPGLTWSQRSQRGLSVRALPSGVIFGIKGPAAFAAAGKSQLANLAIFNSLPFKSCVALQMAFGAFDTGVIRRTPIPELSPEDSLRLANLARRAWSLGRMLDATDETSRAFVLPFGLVERITGFDRTRVERECEELQTQIDDAALALYHLEPEQCDPTVTAAPSSDANAYSQDDAERECEEHEDDEPVGAAVLSSWLIGVSFGRFDPRLATRERAIPPEPEPFDPLPSRSPGMYPDGEEPADRPHILVEDEGHADDLAARAQAVADLVKVEMPENFRGWLAKEFFPLHIKMYSKSRRKAPIYWQLATPAASYSVWLSIHAFSKDTLFRVQNDYAAPKLAHEERRLESLTSELRDKATSAQRNELAAQEAFVEELRAFLDEVKRVAPLWNANLDDGVIINFAPLWRLVPQNKALQKELKSTWDALCDGEYDWAHVAMHLWPERVVPKCAKDRSLAIAHGLEDVLWVERTDGKWTARKAPTRSVDDLVRERTSPAVKAALKSLLEVPTAAGKSGGRRVGVRRKGAAAAEGVDA